MGYTRVITPRDSEMATAVDPGVKAGCLVTVAFLKAQMDAGSDHLSIFMPLALDVISRLPLSTFSVEDIQTGLSAIHNVSMPKHVVASLLRKATKSYLSCEHSLYRLRPGAEIPQSLVDGKKEQIEKNQRRLAEALISHAERRKLVIPSTDAALDLLFTFLDCEQVAILLETPVDEAQKSCMDKRERSVIAEFIEAVVRHDPALLGVLREMLEGMVLYHAAFLPDLNTTTKKFKNLRVVFDSPLLMQALGYEGPALKALLKESTDVLKASGIGCVVFEESLKEIKRLLAMYESRLGTSKGREDLKPGPITRHFLTQRYTPSDMAEMSTLLERDIAAAGFQILARPPRQKEYTAGEKELAARLKRPNSGREFELEPRIVHDVECIAGVLTLRRGKRSNLLEDAGVVFATDSPMVIKCVQQWWREDEKETAVAPIVHIRALTNLAWLKKPALCGDFKIQELVVLCAAALQPQPSTWSRFLKHLSKLQQSERITTDEAAAILVSDMLDRALKTAEFDSDDPDEVDVATLDEVVERVKASYSADAERRVQRAEEEKATVLADAEQRTQLAIERADAAERFAAESARKRAIRIRSRAATWARYVRLGLQWCVNLVLVVGALALLTEHYFHPGAVGIVIACCLILFVLFEFIAVRRHVFGWVEELEASIRDRVAEFLGIDD
jgi:hypothetical protein